MPGRVAEAEPAGPLLDEVAAVLVGHQARAGRRRRRRRPAARAAGRARRATAPPAFLNVMPPTVSEPPSNSTVAGRDQPALGRRDRGDQLERRARRIEALGRAVGERRAVVGVLEALVDRRSTRPSRRRSGRSSGCCRGPSTSPLRGSMATKPPGLPVARERRPGRPSARRSRSTGAAACPGAGRAPTARPSGGRGRRPGSGWRRCAHADSGRTGARCRTGRRGRPAPRPSSAGCSSCFSVTSPSWPNRCAPIVLVRVLAQEDALDLDAREARTGSPGGRGRWAGPRPS